MAKKKANGKRGYLTTYRTYNFIDKDPIIDFARTAVADSKMTYKQIHDETGGVSQTTLSNWFVGKTRRPQFATVAAVLMACKVTDIPLRGILRKRT